MARQRTPMSAVDKSWLRMESPANPMMIGVVLIFDKPIPLAGFRRLLQERFLRYRRFRQRVTYNGDKVWWQDDPYFDLDHHLHVIALPGKGDKQDLQQLASDLNSTPLDKNKPLWQIHYIDNYDGGCALLVRIHHCIADGISLVRVLLSLTEESPDSKVTAMRPGPEILSDKPLWRVTRSLQRWRHQLGLAQERAGKVLDRFRNEEHYLRDLARDYWRIGTSVGKECLRLGLTPADPPTPLKGDLCGRKRVAWAEPLDLAEVKATAKALGGTVNDVLLTAATGALRTYLQQTGETMPEYAIRVAVPFNLRPLHQPIDDLGNQFGLVLVPLPVGIDCPLACFENVQREMNYLKRSRQAQVTYGLLDIFGRGPDVLERRALELLSKKASAVMTNVPGPRKPVYLVGSRLVQPMFWVPQTGNVGVGLSIFSYDNRVQFGIIADKRLIDRPDVVVASFTDSMRTLQARAHGEEKRRYAPLNIA